MILDLPDSGTVSKRRNWTIFELTAFGLSLTSLLIRDSVSLYTQYEAYIFLLHVAFALSYFFAFYWMEKPRRRDARRVVMTIVYGIAFMLLATATFVFLPHYFWYSDEVMMIAIGGVIMAFILDLLSSWGKRMVVNNRILIRVGVFGLLIALMYIVPEHKRVALTFRKYPTFLKYYQERYEDKIFMEIYTDYLKHNKMTRVE